MSSPIALPVAPTRRAEISTSAPAPEPRSSTVSPSCRSATAVGTPQPSDASTAALGAASPSVVVERAAEHLGAVAVGELHVGIGERAGGAAARSACVPQQPDDVFSATAVAAAA